MNLRQKMSHPSRIQIQVLVGTIIVLVRDGHNITKEIGATMGLVCVTHPMGV